jgi:hypothetical protein
MDLFCAIVYFKVGMGTDSNFYVGTLSFIALY